jgi:CDP-diacylglycerol--glycerol-3-phosphate 3-phosphatidyltransferase
MNTEDAFTTLRIILSPAVAALILAGKIEAAFYLYVVAAITDAFDGYFARKHRKKKGKGELFDSLADITLVYFAALAIIIVNRWTWLIALMIVTTAVLVYVVGIISMKKKVMTIPHLKTAKIWAWLVHPTVLAYIVDWKYAGVLLLLSIVVGAFTAAEYIIYAVKCSSD